MEVSRSSFLAPAVAYDGVSLDMNLIQSRSLKIMYVGMAAFAALTLAFLHRPTLFKAVFLPLAAVAFFAVAILMHKFEEWRGNRAIDQNWVHQYMSNERPEDEVMTRIYHSPRAVRMLIEAGADLNKFSVTGTGLVFHNINFEAFRLLIDHGYNLRARGIRDTRVVGLPEHIGFSGFEQIVGSADPRYLRYVLEKRLVNVEDFSQDDQVQFLKWVGNREAIQLLTNYGFDINAVDNFGHTALQNFTSQPFSSGGFLGFDHPFDEEERIAAFREFGAH